MYKPRSKLIKQILDKLGHKENIIYFDHSQYIVDYHINTCVTPPLHPFLWQEAQHKLIGKNSFKVTLKESHIIFLYASGGEPQRSITNYQTVESFLKERYSAVYSLSFDDLTSLETDIDLLSKARIIIGVHGSSMYTIQMATKNCTVIEYMPTTIDGTILPKNAAHTIIWQTADMLGQSYWRINESPLNSFGDVRVNIYRLKRALDIIDMKYKL